MEETSKVRMVSVIYGFLPSKISRKQSQRFIELHAAKRGLMVPQPPIARFWCHPAPAGSPADWAIGWTAPIVPRETHVAPVTWQ